MKRLAALILLILWGTAPLMAETCETMSFRENSFDICTVDLTQDTLELFLYAGNGSPYGYFNTLNSALEAEGKKLGFAMNAGMYHDDRAPVGYYLENGTELQRVISSEGPGNFGLLPNGILCLRGNRADVIETKRFLRQSPVCQSATQSGPMLVIDGKLHPRFLKRSTSRYVRNGVGTSEDGTRAVFAISNNTINFYDFALFFRDLGFGALGPIIGVVTEK